jgi:hypothetical protein
MSPQNQIESNTTIDTTDALEWPSRPHEAVAGELLFRTVPLENLEISEWMGVIFLLLFSSMLISLITLLATLSSMFRSRGALALENLALRHQIGVLQRSARKHPKLTSGDRLLWICLSRLWCDERRAA